MRLITFLFLIGLLAACSSVSPSQPAGSGSGGQGGGATLSSTPTPETLTLGKGETQTLTVSVTRTSPEVAKVRLDITEGADVLVSPNSLFVTFEEGDTATAELQVSVGASPSPGNANPFFYIYGQPLNEKGKSVGGGTPKLSYQWSL